MTVPGHPFYIRAPWNSSQLRQGAAGLWEGEIAPLCILQITAKNKPGHIQIHLKMCEANVSSILRTKQRIQTVFKYQMVWFSLEWSNQCLVNAFNSTVSPSGNYLFSARNFCLVISAGKHCIYYIQKATKIQMAEPTRAPVAFPFSFTFLINMNYIWRQPCFV